MSSLQPQRMEASPPAVELSHVSNTTLDDPTKKNVTVGSINDIVHVENHGEDTDEAMKVATSREACEVSNSEHKRLVRIIDRHLMPLMCVIYGMNFLDKTSLSYASVMGFKQDSHLQGDEYQWLSSMFYFGYLAWEYPTTRLLQRLPLAKYSACCIVIWGLVLALFATVSNFKGAVVVRFFLGVFEAAVTPGFALFTSQWYTKKEQGVRVAIWFSWNGVGLIVGGLLAYGIAVGSRTLGSAIAPWKILFLSNGCLTSCLGIAFYFVMPDNQLNARWLTPRDRILCIERVRINQQGIGNKRFKLYQFKEALVDPITWAMFLFAVLANIPNGGISNFFSQLIVSFGYTAEQALLYGTPAGAVQLVVVVTTGLLGDRLENRILISLLGILIAMVGIMLIITLPLSNATGRLAGYYLTNSASSAFVAVLCFVSTNVAGYTKKTTVAAIYLIGYCIGNIIGPQTFRPENAPHYIPAEITIMCCWGICLLDLGIVRTYYSRQNAKRVKIRSEPGYVKLENQEWLDLTDKENIEFTYTI